MESGTKWNMILSRQRRQLSLDIEHCSPIALREIILDVHTSGHVLDLIAQTYTDDEYLLKDLVLCPNLSEESLAFIALTASEEVKQFLSGRRVLDLVVVDPAAAEGTSDGKAGESAHQKKLNVLQMVNRMTTPQKIKLALKGTKEARSLLIRESNKQISMSVLENPRLTDSEVDFFAKSTNLSEDVMRKIGTHPDWTKKYSIIQSLVFNAKTPVGIAMGFVSKINDRDLGLLEKSRSVSTGVRTAARQMVAKKKLGKK